LIHWGDIIDGAPISDAAVGRIAEPATQLALVFEARQKTACGTESFQNWPTAR